MSDNDRIGLAAEAFIYGFPLVFNLGEMERVATKGLGSVPPTGFNQFGHADKLAGPDDKFVSINNDTVYSIALVDLTAGRLRLSVPDTAGRYYVLQFVDAWTNNFAYIGHRATGTEAGTVLLVPPGDTGDVGDERVIRCPTAMVAIVGRWAVDGEHDLPAVRALQAQLMLSPTSGDSAPSGLPQPDQRVPEEIRFFEQLRGWIHAFPPAARDREYQQRFEPLGLFCAETPYTDAGMLGDLRAGITRGREALEQAVHAGPAPKQNGWDLTYHVFDYNLDFFEIGALDDPTWKLSADPAVRYTVRAGAARAGLWGNHGYEAAYAMVYDDADGNQLRGTERYTLRFDQQPPVGAFWSVTMYNLPDFYLVANPVARYSIGDRTPGLHLADDGSLTLYLQHEEPELPQERANWLPAPAAEFRPILRMYEPGAAVFDGRYELPPIRRR